MFISRLTLVGAVVFASSLTPYSIDAAGAQAPRYNWRAYDTVTRQSPGGWVNALQSALNLGCNQKKAFPNNRVVIQQSINDNWNAATVIREITLPC